MRAWTPPSSSGASSTRSVPGAARGAGDLLVAEADESDGSFLHLVPAIAVLTNIDPEHLDHFGSLAAVKDAFVDFANRVPFYGLVVACLDSPNVQDVLPRIEKRTATYGLAAQSDYRAHEVRFMGLDTSFEVSRRGEPLGRFTVPMPGVHNVLNALATIAVADELRVSLEDVRTSMAAFGGVHRRFTVVGTRGGSRSSTTTGTTQPRSKRRWRRLRAPMVAGWSWPSSPIATRGPSTCSTSSRGPSTEPMSSC
jgi:UDP-N-acetylmuramate-alanine ligase